MLAIVAVIGMVAGAKLATKSDLVSQDRSSAGSGQIAEIVRFIEEQYVDEINSGELMEKAVESILKELDPHSGYISPDELEEINEKMNGEFDGIGVQFHILKDSLVILFVNPEGPADKAGIKAHDRIVEADGMHLVGVNKDDDENRLIRRLRGKKGTILNVKVARHGIDSLLSFDIERDVIPIESVVTSYMLTDNTGYIKVNHFSSHTYGEFMSELESLADNESFEHLVIDLRQNPGGYLKEAINILSQLFKEKGKLLVYTEGEHARKMEYESTGKPYYDVDNVAVLIDDGSASASEIIAGAIQDHDRGIIIGTRSYGKGLVQEQFKLQNGGALRLTVARYYTPSGRCIQRPYESEVSVSNGLPESGEQDTVVYKTSNGRVVESSGGIEPDFEVEPRFDWYGGKAYVTYDQMLEYMFYGFEDTYQGSEESLDDYLTNFTQSDELLTDFAQFIGVPEGHEDRDSLDADWSRVYTMLRAMASSYRYGYDSWYQVMNSEDPVVFKALDLVEEDLRTTLKY